MDDIVDAVALMSPVKIRTLVVDRAAGSFDLNLAQNIRRLRGTVRPGLDTRFDVHVLPVFAHHMNAAIHARDVQASRLGDGDRTNLAGMLLVVSPAPVRVILVRT